MEEDKKLETDHTAWLEDGMQKTAADPKRKPPKNSKGYGRGLIVGAVSGILVMMILMLGLNNAYRHRLEQIEKQYEEAATDQSKISVRLGNKMNQIENLINQYYYEDVDLEAMEDDVYSAMVDSLGDVYSVYYNEEEYKELMQSVSGHFKGVGVVITADEKGAMVVQVYEGGSAKDAGIIPDDVICGLNGEDLAGMDTSLISAKIKSSEDDMAHVKVYRESTDEYYEYDLELREVDIPTVSYEMKEDSIGYIYISQFSSVTGEQFEKAIQDLQSQGMKGLVIDLRNNGGGDLVTTTEMLDLLLPEGIITYTKGKDGTGSEYRSDADQLIQMPMALLVNGNSASASEVFAGALKDYGVATLVGEKTFGKGIVQSIMSLGDGSALKLTVSHYYTPSGICIHGVGIEPDIPVELDADALQKEGATDADDNQLQEALRVVREQIQ